MALTLIRQSAMYLFETRNTSGNSKIKLKEMVLCKKKKPSTAVKNGGSPAKFQSSYRLGKALPAAGQVVIAAEAAMTTQIPMLIEHHHK